MFLLFLFISFINAISSVDDNNQCDTGYFEKSPLFCENCLLYCSKINDLTSVQRKICNPFCSTIINTTSTNTPVVPLGTLLNRSEESGKNLAYIALIIPVALVISIIVTIIYRKKISKAIRQRLRDSQRPSATPADSQRLNSTPTVLDPKRLISYPITNPIYQSQEICPTYTRPAETPLIHDDLAGPNEETVLINQNPVETSTETELINPNPAETTTATVVSDSDTCRLLPLLTVATDSDSCLLLPLPNFDDQEEANSNSTCILPSLYKPKEEPFSKEQEESVNELIGEFKKTKPSLKISSGADVAQTLNISEIPAQSNYPSMNYPDPTPMDETHVSLESGYIMTLSSIITPDNS